MSRIRFGREVLAVIIGFTLSCMLTWLSKDVIYRNDIPYDKIDRTVNTTTVPPSLTNQAPRKILLDCGGNMASTVELFRETYPGGKEFIIHSFEIDDRLTPYFSPYDKHHLHCPLGVADSDGNMTAFTESAWAPDKRKNNGTDMQWGGGTLFVDKAERTNTKSGGRRKLSYRKKIPTVDLSRWIRENTKKEDYVILKLNVEGAEFGILDKMLKDGTFAWIDKCYGEYHVHQPTGLTKAKMQQTMNNVKTNGLPLPMVIWEAESRSYQDFDEMHPIKIPTKSAGLAGEIYRTCMEPNNVALVIEIGMSKKAALNVMSALKAHRANISVTVFVYGEFAEEWPDLVKSWAKVYDIGLRGNHPYPPGHFEAMSPNWIREAVVSAEMRLHELDIIPVYYMPGGTVEQGYLPSELKKRGFRIIKPKSNFPPQSEPSLSYSNHYKYSDVESVPKALRMIYGKLKAADGGILSLDTDFPYTFMNLFFMLDYLVENSGFKLSSLDECITTKIVTGTKK